MWLKNVWVWLSGKKRTIAGLWWGVAIPAVAILYPEGAPEWLDNTIKIVGVALTWLGLGNAGVKSAGKRLAEKGVAALVLLVLLVPLAGCNRKAVKPEPYLPEPTASEPAQQPKELSGVVLDRSELPVDSRPVLVPLVETVYFGFDSDVVGQAAADELSRVAHERAGRAVRLVGGACPVGPTEYNRALGFRRARACGEFLASRGVPTDAIYLTSVGEDVLVQASPELYHLNRRCEIVVE